MPIIVKNERQIEGIERSCRLASSALAFIKPHVAAGTTPAKLDEMIETYILDHGATPAPKGYNGYPAATCISVNEVICHGVPSENVLREGDILNIDVTTILDGYYGDVSCMFTIGEVTEEAKKIIRVAKEGLMAGIAQVYPGNRLSNIGHEIARTALSQDCSVVHQFCGHGVGLQFHEEPQVEHICGPNDGPFLKPGWIFTIEPMVNLGVPHAVIDESDKWTARTADGKLSAQFEHTILVVKNGHRILTSHPT